jgi:dephospho-CoA kinase
VFNGWCYGTSHKEFNSSNVFIFTPGGIASLPKEVIYNSVIVYFDIDESVRYERLLERSDADTIDRRIKSDDDDFKCFINFDIKIIDSNFDCEQLLETIKIYIE